MNNQVEQLTRLLKADLPRCAVTVDAPDAVGGAWMLDVRLAGKRHAVEYRPGKGFGLFQKDAAYGEGPAEIYRTPERAARRLAQLMAATGGEGSRLRFKDLRELYGHSQAQLARKVGIKQSAISRFETRDEVRLGTLAAAIKGLGGRMEVRAHFFDSDVPVILSSSEP